MPCADQVVGTLQYRTAMAWVEDSVCRDLRQRGLLGWATSAGDVAEFVLDKHHNLIFRLIGLLHRPPV